MMILGGDHHQLISSVSPGLLQEIYCTGSAHLSQCYVVRSMHLAWPEAQEDVK